MPTKRAVLDHFKRDELIEVVDRFGLAVPDRRSKAGLIEAVASSRKATLAEILPVMKRDRLKDMCLGLDLDDSGREKQLLVDRLTGGSPTVQKSPKPKKMSESITAPIRMKQDVFVLEDTEKKPFSLERAPNLEPQVSEKPKFHEKFESDSKKNKDPKIGVVDNQHLNKIENDSHPELPSERETGRLRNKVSLPPWGHSQVVFTGPDSSCADLREISPSDLGQMLQQAVAAKTCSINFIVGFLSHKDFPGCDTDTDALVASEIEEFQNGLDEVDDSSSSIALSFGKITNKESSLSIRAWWALCRWHLDTPEASEKWRTVFVDQLRDKDTEMDFPSEWLSQLITNSVNHDDDLFAEWLHGKGHECLELIQSDANQMKDKAVRCASRLATLFCLRQADVRWGQPLVPDRNIFHPKVYVVERNEMPHDTVVIMGSGNWSSQAFSMDDGGGNVEIGLAFRERGHLWQELHGSASPLRAAGRMDTAAAQLTWTARQLFEKSTQLASWADPYATDLRTIKRATTPDLNFCCFGGTPAQPRPVDPSVPEDRTASTETETEPDEPLSEEPLSEEPESIDPEKVEALLKAKGWVIQDYSETASEAAFGVAIRNHPTDTKTVDYALFVKGMPLGAVKIERGAVDSESDDSTNAYAASNIVFIRGNKARLFFRVRDNQTLLVNFWDFKPRPCLVRAFLSPEQMSIGETPEIIKELP